VASLPRVVSPIRPLFERDGIEIALISVELWPSRLVVRLAALPGERTDREQRRHGAEFEAWGKRLVAEGRAAAGDPPEDPGTRLLARLRITVDDGAGRTYTPRSGHTGGSGSEWHGDWFFTVDARPGDGRLTIRVATPEGEAASVPVDVTHSQRQ
jgi:hypothetical protein